jgi:hypothetical protein
MIEPMPTLVVFGLDPDGHPRAGRFAEPDADIALKAAAFLGYQVGRVADAEILEGLPAGNVFAHGIGLIPRVKRTAFEKLIAQRKAKQDEHAGSACENVGL